MAIILEPKRNNTIDGWLMVSTWRRINLNFYAGTYVVEAYEHDLIKRENRLIATGEGMSHTAALQNLAEKIAALDPTVTYE